MKLEAPSLLKVCAHGGLATTICVSLTLTSAVIISPYLSQTYGESILSFLVALAVGCLTGDAIFHLLPHVFLGEPTRQNTIKKNMTWNRPDASNAHDTTVVWRALPIASTIYIFYLLHRLSENYEATKEHTHSRVPKSNKVILSPAKDDSDDKNNQLAQVNGEEGSISPKDERTKLSFMIWMIIIGDAVHSFTDGVAIGGAYSKSFYGGLGTTIAIFFHTVPHGVGDFAVMVTTGLSQTRSFFILSAVMSPMYFGMILGATLGQLMDLTRLIFAVTAGMFLFISLVEMLPRILESKSKEEHKWKLPFLHSSGIFFGLLSMFGLAILEGKLND